MAISYGTITIVDKTDLGQLSVYLTGSTIRQQTCNINTNPDTYYPDWSSTALVVTPHVYYDGHTVSLDSNKLTISWSKVENGGNSIVVPKSTPDTTDPETYGNDGKSLVRQKNLDLNSTGVVYTATITYKPIDGDNTTTITGIASMDFSISSYGQNGANGNPGKTLQLTSSGSYFTYRYDGQHFGTSTIVLTAQKNNEVAGVHWYCDGTPIKVINGNPSTDTSASGWAAASYYTQDSLEIAGKAIDGYVSITTLSPNYSTNRSAQFKVVETNSNDVELTGGMEDYISIYALYEAQPGTDTYSSYLSNDEETIIDLNGSPVLDNAMTQLFISQGGIDDSANWHITVTDNVDSATDFVYTLSNSKDESGSTNLNKYGPDKVQVTTMNVNAAMITFTAVHGTYDNNNTFTPDSAAANIVKIFSLNKSAAVISHSLRLDSVNAVKQKNGQYNPSTIVVDAITRMGGGTEEYRTAGVIKAIAHFTDGTTGSTLTNSANSALSLNLNTIGASKTISYIETILGDVASPDDKQKITISIDGQDGVEAWQVDLTNPFDSISTTFDYVVTNDETYEIPFKVFQGITPKSVYYTGSTTYPRVTATLPQGSSITLEYYNGNIKVTQTNQVVDRIKISMTHDVTNIGSEGIINLTFDIDNTHQVVKQYSYKAIPESAAPISVHLFARPSDTFTNQSGTLLAQTIIMEGVTDISNKASAINSLTWYYFDSGAWKLIKNSGTAGRGEYVNAGIQTGKLTNEEQDNTFTAVANGDKTAKFLQVAGSVIEGYGAFKLVASINSGGETLTYTEYINFKDVDDPLHVSLHSTLGEQLVNSQGVGVIYVRVLQGLDPIDELPPDDQIGVGATAPSGTINTGAFANKLGYCVYDSTNNYMIDYYQRSSVSGTWTKRTAPEGKYYWYFRDKNNNPISTSDTSISANLRALQGGAVTHQQFVYLTGSVVASKLIADVKVEL